MKDTLSETMDKLQNLRDVIVTLASEHIETIMPGYTHLQHAQPISFGHHLMAYYSMLTRDFERFAFNMKHADISPLGAAFKLERLSPLTGKKRRHSWALATFM
jgi:argininosuccinate lyase